MIGDDKTGLETDVSDTNIKSLGSSSIKKKQNIKNQKF